MLHGTITQTMEHVNPVLISINDIFIFLNYSIIPLWSNTLKNGYLFAETLLKSSTLMLHGQEECIQFFRDS